jgi:succinyl-diaminopimelate desuccinylase
LAPIDPRNPVDPIELTRALIRCPSVTPAEAGALDLLQKTLEGIGFRCWRLPFQAADSVAVDNLYARWGEGAGPAFAFAGHSDVVPVGDAAGWSSDPFAAEIRDGRLFGRGAADMKAAIACFVAAAERFLARRGEGFPGRIALLITGDEEGPSVNGTKPMLGWLKQQGERLDACLVGEPTNPEALGDTVKIGRRGSMSGWLTVHGVQGHSAYPHLADNPVHRLIRMLDSITREPLDGGTEHFQPSTLQVTSVDVGNPASNVIPASARAIFNIRFNDAHSSAGLTRWLNEQFAGVGGRYELKLHVSGESFLTPPGPLSEIISTAIEQAVGRRPELSTTGGTSDARFIKDHCPVAEFGMVGRSMHKVDEEVALADIERLAAIYERILDGFFAAC